MFSSSNTLAFCRCLETLPLDMDISSARIHTSGTSVFVVDGINQLVHRDPSVKFAPFLSDIQAKCIYFTEPYPQNIRHVFTSLNPTRKTLDMYLLHWTLPLKH